MKPGVASRVLHGLGDRPLEWQSVAIVAAAAAVAEGGRPGAGFTLAEGISDPVARFVAAAAAETALPRGRWERLGALASSVPEPDRAPAALAAEPYLARIDPGLAAQLILELVGAAGIAGDAALGLCLAARAETDPSGPWGLERRPDGYRLQLAADRTARRGVRARASGAADPELSAALAGLDGTRLSSNEASSYLVAQAALDPTAALAMADALLRIHGPSSLQSALEVVALAAADAGLSGAVLERARRDGFVSEQATWTVAGALAGVWPRSALADQVLTLSRRVADELDAGREWLASGPVVVAAAAGGVLDRLDALPGLDPLQIVTAWFHAGVPRAEDIGDAAAFLARAGSSASDSALCADIMDLAVISPFRPVPGSLLDIVRWTPGS